VEGLDARDGDQRWQRFASPGGSGCTWQRLAWPGGVPVREVDWEDLPGEVPVCGLVGVGTVWLGVLGDVALELGRWPTAGAHGGGPEEGACVCVLWPGLLVGLLPGLRPGPLVGLECERADGLPDCGCAGAVD
jgi:hypothetical protein